MARSPLVPLATNGAGETATCWSSTAIAACCHDLTGVTDGAGIRITTWTYDAQDRACSSEHAGGSDKVTLDFGSSQTTVTAATERQSVYVAAQPA